MSNSIKQKILVVSHCFFNDAAKVKGQNEHEFAEERIAKRAFLKKMLSDEVELIQLPCPEMILYGANRWAHASSQFDTPHYRSECRRMLEPIAEQLEEYAKHSNRYELLGVVGVDGSPSCGINYTLDGNWGGELCNNPYLQYTLNQLQRVAKSGIMMAVFKEVLLEHKVVLNFYSLETYPNRTSSSAYDFMDITLDGSKKEVSRTEAPKSEFAQKRDSL